MTEYDGVLWIFEFLAKLLGLSFIACVLLFAADAVGEEIRRRMR